MQPGTNYKRNLTRIKCAHCDRPQRIVHARCRCCGSKLPLWYLRTALLLAAALFIIAAILTALFTHTIAAAASGKTPTA